MKKRLISILLIVLIILSVVPAYAVGDTTGDITQETDFESLRTLIGIRG